MRYIRRIDNHLTVKAFGYVEAGGLGSFAPDIYEETEGELPEGWSLEKEEPLNPTISDAIMFIENLELDKTVKSGIVASLLEANNAF